jgi:hypothetical protein
MRSSAARPGPGTLAVRSDSSAVSSIQRGFTATTSLWSGDGASRLSKLIWVNAVQCRCRNHLANGHWRVLAERAR